MKVFGAAKRTIWLNADGTVGIIDQNRLPFAYRELTLASVNEAANAIRNMNVRGAGLIGATAGFGMYLAVRERAFPSDADLASQLRSAGELLKETRPTASNLAWAVDIMTERIRSLGSGKSLGAEAARYASEIADFDAEACRSIGTHALPIIREILDRTSGRPVQILTHCNAGWLAFVDFGSATSPIYLAHDSSLPIHVWVSETRPRNQGARLTAWELGMHGVPHTLIPDNASGHLMQHGLVDLVIVGADRVTGTGDVANKIGTYLKAVAARDNDIPFYVALPSSTFDLDIRDGIESIPIEERHEDEIRYVSGVGTTADPKVDDTGAKETRVRICPENTRAINYGFDVTPARLITGLITELGVCRATESEIATLLSRRRMGG